jgi:cobalt/nickel transport system permease protein
MSASHGAGPAPDRLHGPLTGLAPEVKVVGLVAFLLVVAVTPPSAPWALAAQGAVAVAVAGLALVDPRAVAGRLALDLPLAVLAVVYALAGKGPHVDVLGIGLSQPGLRVGLTVLAKATIGIVAVSALAASTSVPATIAGLARLGFPAWFRHLLALSVRQLQVLRADLARIRRAVEVRTAAARRTVTLAAGARSLGMLFVRSTERADTLRLAADLRGGGPGEAIGPRPRQAPSAERPARPGPAAWVAGLAPALMAGAAVISSAGLP